MTHMYEYAHTMVSACSQGCRAGGVSLELEHWKPLCSCSRGVPSFCMGAGMGLNDGTLGGGRDGWWLMCRQRRSLLCVGEAHKAASVCGGTERQDAAALRLSAEASFQRVQNYFLSAFSVHLCPPAHVVSPSLAAQLRALPVL